MLISLQWQLVSVYVCALRMQFSRCGSIRRTTDWMHSHTHTHADTATHWNTVSALCTSFPHSINERSSEGRLWCASLFFFFFIFYVVAVSQCSFSAFIFYSTYRFGRFSFFLRLHFTMSFFLFRFAVCCASSVGRLVGLLLHMTTWNEHELKMVFSSMSLLLSSLVDRLVCFVRKKWKTNPGVTNTEQAATGTAQNIPLRFCCSSFFRGNRRSYRMRLCWCKSMPVTLSSHKRRRIESHVLDFGLTLNDA